MTTKTAKPKASTKTTAQATETPGNSVPPGRVLMDIPCYLIDVVPGLNPRKTFDAEDQKRLAESIKSKTQLAPVGVRPSSKKQGRYDLMFGERRFRAIHHELRLSTIWCRVINADDELQAALTDDENATQRPLNPIEAAESLALRLRASGMSQNAFAQLNGVSQGAVSNTLRLLELPEPIRQMVISGEIAPAYARTLIPFMDSPVLSQAICEELADAVKKLDPGSSLSAGAVRGCLIEVGRQYGRPVNGYYWDKVARVNLLIGLGDDIPAQTRSRLDIREFPTYSVGRTELLAFNIAAWEEAQRQWKIDEAARQSAKADESDEDDEDGEGGDDDGDNSQGAGESIRVDRRTPAQKEKDYQRGLRSYAMQWHQQIIARWLPDIELQFRNRLLLHLCISGAYERRGQSLLKEVLEPYAVELKLDPLSDDPDLLYTLSECSEGKVNDIGLSLLARWVQADVNEFGDEGLTPWTLSMMISELGIDLNTHWKPDIEFLAIHTDEQLAELVKEWKLKKFPTDRPNLEKFILDQVGLKPPVRLLAIEIMPTETAEGKGHEDAATT